MVYWAWNEFKLREHGTGTHKPEFHHVSFAVNWPVTTPVPLTYAMTSYNWHRAAVSKQQLPWRQCLVMWRHCWSLTPCELDSTDHYTANQHFQTITGQWAAGLLAGARRILHDYRSFPGTYGVVYRSARCTLHTFLSERFKTKAVGDREQ